MVARGEENDPFCRVGKLGPLFPKPRVPIRRSVAACTLHRVPALFFGATLLKLLRISTLAYFDCSVGGVCPPPAADRD